MKYIILLGDGMSDEACDALNGKTPLEAATTPTLDWFARNGDVGLVPTVPDTLHPGSDVANMGVLGYDPRLYYSGRGPIEAAAMGITVPDDFIIFRCNLVSIINNTMSDFTAGHISNEKGAQLLSELNAHFKETGIQFYPGVGYRNIVLLPKKYKSLVTTAPHDIIDQDISASLPKGDYENDMASFITECHHRIKKSSIDTASTHIWPWSQGPYPKMPSFKKKFAISGGIVTAVDLLKGLATLTGLHAPNIEGATGFTDTNYPNKMNAAFKLLNTHDFCYIHIEAPDECGHMGDALLKTQSIEDFDNNVCHPIQRYCQKNPNTIVLIMPDHPTPCRLRTHTRSPVPFILYSPNSTPSFTAQRYTEHHAKKTGLIASSSWELTTHMIEKKSLLPTQ
jgi:2,3-bisphosphoglycerate-independent phosphoglycerate mutase